MTAKKVKPSRYPVVKLEGKGTLVIPAEVLAHITYLHASIGKTEWSGILMYDVDKGDPSKPETFVLRAKHIFLMDIGSAAYTEYETDEDVIDIYNQFDDAMQWKMGHIHTHHSMGAYFSGTDDSELHDNVDKHNYYLSLIVNMDGEYVAKVVFLSEGTETKLNFKNDSGKLKRFTRKEEDTETMVSLDMQIMYGGIDEFSSARLKKIKAKEKAKPIVVYGGAYQNKYSKKKDEKGKANNIIEDDEHSYPYRQGSFYGEDNYGHGYGNDIGYRNKGHLNYGTLDPDPDMLTDAEVESLSRNIVAASPELKEVRPLYSVLLDIQTSTKNGTAEKYMDNMIDSIDGVLDKFFGRPITLDELTECMEEVISSVARFKLNFLLKGVVEEVLNALMAFLAEEQLDEEEIEEDEKKDDNDDTDKTVKTTIISSKKAEEELTKEIKALK